MHLLLLFQEKHPLKNESTMHQNGFDRVNTSFELFSLNEILQNFRSLQVLYYQDVYTSDNFDTKSKTSDSWKCNTNSLLRVHL